MDTALFGSVEEALTRLFAVDDPPEGWFSGSFLAAVPRDAIAQALRRSRQRGGSLLTVSASGQSAELQFNDGRMSAQALLDEHGRIATLYLGPMRPTQLGVDELARRLSELVGESSIYAAHEGREVVAINAGRDMAIASCFKLAVVLALRERVDGGELAWHTVVHLDPAWKSLPSGMLHDWPAGTAVTLETLAALTLSLSDNTATDALMDIVGRALIERSGYLRAPVLSTREAFVLRDPASADLYQDYRTGDPTLRRAAMTACRERSLPSFDIITAQPREKTTVTEWYSTAQELARLAEQVSVLPTATLGRSQISSRPWTRVTAKVGREPGVAAWAAALEHEQAGRFSLAVIWNALASDSEADEPDELAGLVAALADALAEQTPAGT